MMNMMIDATTIVGSGFPPDEGKKLADKLLASAEVTWEDLQIDLSGCTAALLISAFFNGFLQEVFDRRAELLNQARRIDWRLRFDFQRDNVKRWMREFKPFTDAGSVN